MEYGTEASWDRKLEEADEAIWDFRVSERCAASEEGASETSGWREWEIERW